MNGKMGLEKSHKKFFKEIGFSYRPISSYFVSVYQRVTLESRMGFL